MNVSKLSQTVEVQETALLLYMADFAISYPKKKTQSNRVPVTVEFMTCYVECVTISLCTTICDICWDFVRDEPCLLSLLCKNHGVKSDFCQNLAALKTQSKCLCISTATQIRGISKSFEPSVLKTLGIIPQT